MYFDCVQIHTKLIESLTSYYLFFIRQKCKVRALPQLLLKKFTEMLNFFLVVTPIAIIAWTEATVIWFNFKVVTNEKQGGPGSWQMIDIGPGPWW